jgi:hypothetical protein
MSVRFRQANISKQFRINRKILPKVNKSLKKYNGLNDSIPITKIYKDLKKFGLVLINEDGTEFAGIFAGRKGRTTIDIAGYDKRSEEWKMASNMELIIIWNKRNKKYEITTYIN